SASSRYGRRTCTTSGESDGALTAFWMTPRQRKSATCCAIAMATFTCASPVEAPRCGVAITCSSARSGCPLGGGSSAKTSIAEPDDAERLVADLGADPALARPLARLHRGIRLRDVAGEREQHRDRVLGGRDVAPAGGVHDDDAALGGGVDVDVVDADAGPADHAQHVGTGEVLGRHLGAAAHDESVEAADRLAELAGTERGARDDP